MVFCHHLHVFGIHARIAVGFCDLFPLTVTHCHIGHIVSICLLMLFLTCQFYSYHACWIHFLLSKFLCVCVCVHELLSHEMLSCCSFLVGAFDYIL